MCFQKAIHTPWALPREYLSASRWGTMSAGVCWEDFCFSLKYRNPHFRFLHSPKSPLIEARSLCSWECKIHWAIWQASKRELDSNSMVKALTWKRRAFGSESCFSRGGEWRVQVPCSGYSVARWWEKSPRKQDMGVGWGKQPTTQDTGQILVYSY